jgi:hypothetical protein
MPEPVTPPAAARNKDIPKGTRLLFAIFALVMIVVIVVQSGSAEYDNQDSCRLTTGTHGLACTGHGSGTIRHA